MPVAAATPPVIVHDVGTNMAGYSPADDNGTEVRTGIVIDGPTEAAGGLDVTADVAGEDRDKLTDVAAVGDALRLPACLPTKNAPRQIPMTATNPSIDSRRLLAGSLS